MDVLTPTVTFLAYRSHRPEQMGVRPVRHADSRTRMQIGTAFLHGPTPSCTS